jgi:Mg-chelatase subunit ChlD
MKGKLFFGCAPAVPAAAGHDGHDAGMGMRRVTKHKYVKGEDNMKKRFPFFLGAMIVICLVMGFTVDLAGQGDSKRVLKTLTTRTQLRPVAWKTGVTLWFAPGPYAEDGWEGGVQSGILDETATLQVWNTTRKETFGPGFIRFERGAGGVKEGTLAADTTLCVVNTAAPSKISLAFAGITATVEFGYDGCVMKGTLAAEATLRSWNGKSDTYPPGTLVEFNGAGELIRAVLPGAGATALDGEYTGTLELGCPEGVWWLEKGKSFKILPFHFTAKDGTFAGGHDDRPYSLQWQGNYDATGKISNGMMTGWIDFDHPAYRHLEPKLRWTITGPIEGTLRAPAGGRLTVNSSTDPDRLPEPIVCTGTWSAVKKPGMDLTPTVEGTVIDIAKGAKGCMDLIFVIDQTSSMSDDIDQVKKTAKAILAKIAAAFPDFRVAIVGYRDWGDTEIFRDIPFSSNAAEIQTSIDSLTSSGGGDTPEAVLEALLRAIRLPWRDGCNKQIILMGDAPPHSPIPQGPDKDKTADDVVKAAYEVDPAVINTILIANSPGSFSEEARTAFADLATRSSGTATTADKAEEVPQKMMEMVETIKKSAPPAVAAGGGGGVVGIPSSGFPTWAIILLGLLGVLLIAAAIAAVMRRRGAAPAGGGLTIQASLEVVFAAGGRQTYRINAARTAIGRAVDNQLVIDDPSVSLHHAEILASGQGFLIRDLGSANGTLVNGSRTNECQLYLGDEIAMGSVRVKLNG